jgi:hypothetical protein
MPRYEEVLICRISASADSCSEQWTVCELWKHSSNEFPNSNFCFFWDTMLWMITSITWDRTRLAVWSSTHPRLVSLSCITYLDPSCFSIWFEKEPKLMIVNDRRALILFCFIFCELKYGQASSISTRDAVIIREEELAMQL